MFRRFMGVCFLVAFLATNLHSARYSVQANSGTQDSLKALWKKRGMSIPEGIYEKLYEEPLRPKYKLALVKYGDSYSLVFLAASGSILLEDNGHFTDYTSSWKEGYIKANLVQTATSNIFKAEWRIADSSIVDALLIVDESGFKVYWPEDNISDYYIKLYPASYERGKIPSPTNPPNNTPKVEFWSGTGFAVSRDGVIATNYHVIQDSKFIKIYGITGYEHDSLRAIIILTDKNNDLALIKITDSRFHGFGNIPYTIRSKPLESGERIFVLGYPLPDSMGQEIKITDGIISSKTGFRDDTTTY